MINYSTGTSTIERILRITYGNFTIGTSMTDSLGTSDIRHFIEDGERYIDGSLEEIAAPTPVTPAPQSLKFASDYMGAYLCYTGAFAANKPDAESSVVVSWKAMADASIKSYKTGFVASGGVVTAGFTTATRLFNYRGIDGIKDGFLEDDKDIKTYKRK